MSGVTPAPGGPARLTFASGGWAIVAALLLVVGIVLWSLVGVWSGRGRVGDGTSVESYGFDLSNLRVPRETFVASGMARDGLPALDNPVVLDGREIPTINTQRRRKLVVSTDRVLGVVVDGIARAYPLRVLNGHEVVNDEIAGVPIVVTYSPLGDAAAVFSRRIGERTRRFGVSGLLDRSNLVFYDRDTESPSLWGQLSMEAIAGPLAGTPLEPLPGVVITTWAAWLARHPHSEIIDGDPALGRRYASTSYTRYFTNNSFLFPMPPAPSSPQETPALARKAPVVALRDPRDASKWMVLPTERIRVALGRSDSGEIEVDGLRLRAEVTAAHAPGEPAGARLEPFDGDPLMTVPSLWFVWRAFHPDAQIEVITRPEESAAADPSR
ncbi:MAG: DUF3179 domain-containing protein [Phycisphaeraceae bacterium]|nr:DUF3179 domain-containing protein [Phycisphaeraceae bacterium]